MGWVKSATGRMKYVADVEYTPEELEAANARVRAQVADGGRGIGIGIWNPASTVQATGEEMSKAEFEAFKKRTGAVEVDRGDTSERKPKSSLGDIAKKAIEDAKQMLLETQQYVTPGTPTTEKTRELQQKGLPIIRTPDEAPEEPVKRGETQAEVDAKRVPGQPWGYVGGKEDIIAQAAEAAKFRATERVIDKGLV